MNTRISILALAAAATLLSSCGAPSGGEPEKPAPDAEATPSPEEPISILRPDIEPPEVEPPELLEPLNLVVGFPDGGAKLSETAIASLQAILESEQIATDASIVLRGHSDAGGNGEVNKRVSRQRAEAVRDWLVKNDVAEDRIEIIVFGEQNPVRPNALPNGKPNEAGRAANRRVELVIVPPRGTVQRDPQPDASASPSGTPGD